LGNSTKQRRALRVSFERVRQALRDVLAERDVAADRPPKEIARWLAGRPSAELLGEPGAYRELPLLAATTRAMVAG
jgi:hypothetical protein